MAKKGGSGRRGSRRSGGNKLARSARGHLSGRRGRFKTDQALKASIQGLTSAEAAKFRQAASKLTTGVPKVLQRRSKRVP